MQPNTMKSAMQNGLIMGVIFSINFLLSTQKNSALILLTYVIAIIIVTLLHKQIVKFRDTECDGIISYRKALSYIVLIFFYAALITTPVEYIYIRYLNPDFLSLSLTESAKIYELVNKTKINQDEIMRLRTIITPISYTILHIWVVVLIGTFTGLIMAIFVKKQKKSL